LLLSRAWQGSRFRVYTILALEHAPPEERADGKEPVSRLVVEVVAASLLRAGPGERAALGPALFQRTREQLTLLLPLTQDAEESLRLQFLQEYNEDLDGLWIFQDATLTFEGLPAGTSITSCHGYRQDAAVPTSHTTWGSLKARYR